MGEVVEFACPKTEELDDVWYFRIEVQALADDLRLASVEIQRSDCDGNINADIPVMVLTDLAALTLEQWEGDAPNMGRKKAACHDVRGVGLNVRLVQG